jgi:Kef-type K+ transport system membrane component KefB
VTSVAFIVAHVAADWLSRRFGIVTGVEYIVVGAVVGPALGLLTEERLIQVSPALVLGEGSLGLLVGVLLNFRDSTRTSARALGVAITVTLGTLLFVAGLPLLGIGYFVGMENLARWVPQILCAGAVACVAGLAPLRSLINFLDARGPGSELILRVGYACSSLAIAVFGLIFCLFKPASDLLVGTQLGALESFLFWLGIHVVIGAVLGVVFTLFLLRDFEDEKILTVVIGMVIFTSGVAYYLKLSPIFVCFVVGVVLANICNQSDHVSQMLLSVQRPLYIVIFFFVGASIPFDVAWWTWLLAIPYLLLRAMGRFTGGLAANRLWPTMRQLPQVGAALLAPGALSAAMLLNFNQVFQGEPFTAQTYAVLLLGIVVSEPLAFRFSRRWLIDATDVALGREAQGGSS